MNILFVVTQPGSAQYLQGIGEACIRNGIEYAIFFSGDGVQTLQMQILTDTLGGAREVVACEFSWQQKMAGLGCPVTEGSQTDHSRMLGIAGRVGSL